MSATMSLRKQDNKKKRKLNRTNSNIKKLFGYLRNESKSSITSGDLENTVIEVESQTQLNKRKISQSDIEPVKRKRNQSNESIIIISDDSTLQTNEGHCSLSTPKKSSTINCSTPIHSKNDKSLQDLIVANFPTRSNNNLTEVKNQNEEVTDLTKDINYDSFVTIDLTTETLNSSALSKVENTVIHINDTDNDCTVVSVSNASLSMSGDSEVTVLHLSKNKKEKQMRRFANGIAKLGASEKDRLLQLITQNIFNGCNVPSPKGKGSIGKIKESTTRATETVQDTYIKEVILGITNSRNSIGSNIYNPERDPKNKTGLRMIVIDGSNVAMEYTKGREFSVKALKICIDYFLNRGHLVKAFVPRFRCKFGKSTEPRVLDDLERRGLVVYTPSREIQGRMVTSYDDRYIVQCAAEFDAVIVSGDNYRDLMAENPRWRFVIENRLLQFTWVNDMIMFPKDPLGRYGPSLEQFLTHPS